MDTQNKQKHHWLDDVKWHNPDYKWDWASAVFSWKIVGLFIGFWILLNILPWQTIGQLPGYSDLTYWVNKLIPMYDKIPVEIRYSGLKEQLTIINFLGLLYLVYCLIKTGNIHIVKTAPWWTVPLGCLGSAVLFLIMATTLVTEGEIMDDSREALISQDPQEWEMTLKLIFMWYGTGLIFVFMLGYSRTFFTQIYNLLRRK